MKSSCHWKRVLCFLLSLATCVTLFACNSKQPPDKPDGPQTPENPDRPDGPDDPGKDEEDPPMYTTPISEVIITSGSDRLAVNFCREDLVHFRYAPRGEAFAPEGSVPESIAKFDGDYADVCGEIEATDGKTVIRTEVLTVTIDAATLGITITDLEGNEIFKSAAEAFSADGQSKTAGFVRDVATTEHFFGLGNAKGDSFTTTDHRNTVYDLWMHDDNVHAILPLWYSTAGYGIYVNNSNRGSVSFKSDYSLSLEGGEMNFYFLYGPDFKTILSNWSELAGRMAMPPLYSLGLTYRGLAAGRRISCARPSPRSSTPVFRSTLRALNPAGRPKRILAVMRGIRNSPAIPQPLLRVCTTLVCTSIFGSILTSLPQRRSTRISFLTRSPAVRSARAIGKVKAVTTPSAASFPT